MTGQTQSGQTREGAREARRRRAAAGMEGSSSARFCKRVGASRRSVHWKEGTRTGAQPGGGGRKHSHTHFELDGARVVAMMILRLHIHI